LQINLKMSRLRDEIDGKTWSRLTGYYWRSLYIVRVRDSGSDVCSVEMIELIGVAILSRDEMPVETPERRS
jgi:hypothetical protein